MCIIASLAPAFGAIHQLQVSERPLSGKASDRSMTEIGAHSRSSAYANTCPAALEPFVSRGFRFLE